MKRCRTCRAEFTPKRSTLEVCCSPKCAIEYVRKTPQKRLDAHRRRAQAKEKREDKEKLRRRRDWVKLAQEAFNAYIRARDEILPCVSCGRSTGSKRNAGHFRSVGAAPQLRFDEQNCWSQCEHCNSFLSGNQLQYRASLVGLIGLDAVERLENDNAVRRHSIDELKAVIATYRGKLRELRAVRAA